jgi:predicted transposase/invertase (TIGR01784 family)
MESNNNNGNRQLIPFDWAVKHLLRDKANFEIVEGFFSELLGRQVKISNVLESKSNKEYNRVDVAVKDKDGRIILIALQSMPDIDFFQRMKYGLINSGLAKCLIREGIYMKVKEVYSIDIDYFDFEKDRDYVYYGKTNSIGLHNKEILDLSKSPENPYAEFAADDILPEYYLVKINQFNDIIRDTLDEWIYFLKHNRIKEDFSARGLLKAHDILDYNCLSPSEKAEYDLFTQNKG